MYFVRTHFFYLYFITRNCSLLIKLFLYMDLNLITYSDFLSDSMAQRTQVDVVYTDFSKCFDRIDHVILLRKLSLAGIRGNLFRWFKSYVEGRCQTVVLNGYTSRAMGVNSGVPQGSLLGPFLFNIFINDISSCIQYSKILLYADDVKIMKQISSVEDAYLLQKDLHSFQDYCSKNRLDLNVSKCYTCSFTRKQNRIQIPYQLCGTCLTRVDTIRDLGVIFDSKLIFVMHIENVVSKATKALGFIFRISSEFKHIKTVKILYCSFVRSHLEYASQVWNPTYKTYIDRLERVQKKFLRHIQWRSNCYLPTYISRCRNFHFLPLVERRRIADLTFLLSIFNGALDTPELLNKFGLRVPSARFRKFNLLDIPYASNTYRQNSYIVRASRSFNTVSQEFDVDLFHTSVPKLKKTLCDSFFFS